MKKLLLALGLLLAGLGSALADYSGPAYIPPPYVTQRQPGLTDDSTKGYAVGNYWLYNGQLWQASSVLAGAATWAQVGTISGPPGDSVPKAGSGDAAYGMVNLRSGFTSSPLLCRNKQSASYATSASFGFSFSALPNGGNSRVVSYSDLDAFAALADSGQRTECAPKDQFNSNDTAFVSTTNPGLILGHQQVNGLRPLVNDWTANQFWLTPSSGAAGVLISTGASVSLDAFSVVLVGRTETNANGTLTTSRPDSIAYLGTGTSNYFWWFTTAPQAGFTSNLGMQYSIKTNVVGQNWGIQQNDLGLYAAVFSTAAATLYRNDFSLAATKTAQSTSVSGGFVGTNAFGTQGAGADYLALLVYAKTLSASDIDKIRQWAYVTFNIYPQVRDQLYTIGTSFDEGYYGSENQGSSQQGWALAKRPFRLFVNGTGSRKNSEALSEGAATAVAPQSGALNIATFEFGLNGVTSTATADSELAAGFAVVDALRTTGWNVVCETTAGVAAAFMTVELQTYYANAVRAAQARHCAAFADIAASNVIGIGSDTTNPTYRTGDSVPHITQTGYGAWGALRAQAINQIAQ